MPSPSSASVAIGSLHVAYRCWQRGMMRAASTSISSTCTKPMSASPASDWVASIPGNRRGTTQPANGQLAHVAIIRQPAGAPRTWELLPHRDGEDQECGQHGGGDGQPAAVGSDAVSIRHPAEFDVEQVANTCNQGTVQPLSGSQSASRDGHAAAAAAAAGGGRLAVQRKPLTTCPADFRGRPSRRAHLLNESAAAHRHTGPGGPVTSIRSNWEWDTLQRRACAPFGALQGRRTWAERRRHCTPLCGRHLDFGRSPPLHPLHPDQRCGGRRLHQLLAVDFAAAARLSFPALHNRSAAAQSRQP